MNLGKTIKAIRKHQKIRQGAFCKSVGISQPYLSQIEANRKKANPDVMQKISDKLGFPLPILYWLSIDESDVQRGKVKHFRAMKPNADALIFEAFGLTESSYIKSIQQSALDKAAEQK